MRGPYYGYAPEDFLFFAGYNDQCRSFLRHNGKGRS